MKENSMSNLLFDTLLSNRSVDHRPFLRLADGRVWSYAEILAYSGRLANALCDLDAQPGDRIAVQVEKSPDALALYFSCLCAGFVFLPLNTAYTFNEVNYIVGDAKPAVIVCDGHRQDELMPLAKNHGAKLVSLSSGERGSLAEKAHELTGLFKTVPRNADDLAAILYTSGTTGRPKGAMLSHANLLSNAEVLAKEWCFTENDVLLHALPIYHTHGLFVAVNVTLVAGGSMIFLPKFDTGEIIRLLPQATVMMGVPTFYTRLLACDNFSSDTAPHMRLFISGSAPLFASTHAAFENRTGSRILERYGMTETNMITSNPYHGERRAGSVGFPLPGIEIKITDQKSGVELPQGEVGVIEVRGPNVFYGYWQMPEKTAADLRESGFFITGDLGVIDTVGYLQIVGRAKDLIISGGFNVYPKEVELAIDRIDGVLESAVFGVPHTDLGEGVTAAVVLTHKTRFTEEDIQAALKGILARFKQPKRIIFMGALPRNTMGKVQKNILRDQNSALFAKAFRHH